MVLLFLTAELHEITNLFPFTQKFLSLLLHNVNMFNEYLSLIILNIEAGVLFYIDVGMGFEKSCRQVLLATA